MNCLSKRLLICATFGFLFFVAATADLMATSSFSDGHHANNPVLRIEHKCIAGLEKVTTLEEQHATHSIAPAENISHNLLEIWLKDLAAKAVIAVSVYVHPVVPLRC